MMFKRLILVLSLMLAGPAIAVEPSEMLDDPALEARAREVSKELRCLVCRNENIDDSNASLAKELRVLVRDRIAAGDSNEETIDYLVDRYGEYVLLKPTVTGSNLLLYIAGPAMLLIGFGVALFYIRGRNRRSITAPEQLSPDEEARLKEILGR
ncbi:cytochrome c-type biogenesis protein CcmH [Rhodovulum bhavnagarense]|uniref:Cytochrome c-type biogenesis protein n=2 Tax=Rhodovulum bhavnagarense TaxID=992286 RepID=A0A4R2RKE6_9RHOB|nr:cytochrome c-type biogenesis protein [Rhodovulum bhavnagarense]TCP63278.1 cytochrome c-type biogenesis protein CcmH [Rhodovulum bhavnagarense]